MIRSENYNLTSAGQGLLSKLRGSQNLERDFKATTSNPLFMDGKNDNMYQTLFNDGLEGQFASTLFDIWDLEVNLPLAGLFATGNVPFRFGGGYAETVNAFRINYNFVKGRLAGTKTNSRGTAEDIKTIPITVPVYGLEYVVEATELEKRKFEVLNTDIFPWKLETIRRSFQVELEKHAFIGNLGIDDITESSIDFYGGLFNQKLGNNKGDLGTVETHKQVLTDNFYEYTVDQAIEMFSNSLQKARKVLLFDSSKYPNTIAVPTDLLDRWVRPATIGSANNAPIYTNIVDYMEEALTRQLGDVVRIVPMPYLQNGITEKDTTAGIVANGDNGTGMIVLYRNDENTLRVRVPMPLTAGRMGYDRQGEFLPMYGFVSPLMVIYPSIFYIHNGTIA